MSKNTIMKPGAAVELDSKFNKAVECFLEAGRGSTSVLQRKMGLGYTRAAAICDQMEALGLIGPYCGAQGHELLIDSDDWRKRRKAWWSVTVELGGGLGGILSVIEEWNIRRIREMRCCRTTKSMLKSTPADPHVKV